MSLPVESHPFYDRNRVSAREYWAKVISAGCGEAIIPIGRSRRAQRSVEAPLTLTISGDTFERLMKLTAESSFLLYVTLLAAAKACLYKYSRKSMITAGGPSWGTDDNRPEPPHVLSIVDGIDGGMSFRTLLLGVKETVIEAYQYRDYPLKDFINDFGADDERQFQPQVVVTVKDFHGDVPPLRSDVRLSFERRAAEVHGTVSFDESLFSHNLIRRFTGDLLNILSLALQDTTTSINDLSALTPGERQQLLVDWNGADRPFPDNCCVHELFVSQVHHTPEAVAVIYDGQHVTYLELNRRANQLARYLNFLGVRPEDRVGLCMKRGLEMVVGILGLLKAGGVYVPLDPGYPAARLAYMLNDAQVTIFLTQRQLLESIPLEDVTAVCLDQEWERIGRESDEEPGGGVKAGNLAYVIYTSGSTGRPKGVMVTHQAICNLVEAQKVALGLGPQSRVLQFASLSFDASVWEIFSILATGGSLHARAPEELMPGPDLMKVLKEDAITVMTLPPTALSMLADGELFLPSTVIVAGEACSAEIVDRWARGRRLLNAYGPTEATVCATIGECEVGGDSPPAIGRPIANTRLYILDRELEPVPVEVSGELYISGVGVARGYWGKPELTAERFIPDTFDRDGGARLYRTGDVCRYLPDGSVEFIGRTDEQVKIRGYRIELREIEAALNEHPSVRQSVVVVGGEEKTGQRLLGYVVGEKKVTAAELKAHVRERLPEYMIPEAVLVLEEMPLTVNGKIDRKRLPSIEGIGRQSEQEYVGARTPVEELLVGIFEEVLKLDRVGRNDNFFEIGGHSLLATQVVSRARSIFGVEVGVRGVFERPTAGGLAENIEEAIRSGMKQGALSPITPFEGGHRSGRPPLSFEQRRLWFIEQSELGGVTPHVIGKVRLDGNLDCSVMESAINKVIERHEVLRARVEVEDGEPVQVIDEWGYRKLAVTDLTIMPPEERDCELDRISREDARTAFDLGRGPLLRVRILKLQEARHVLLFTMHPIVGDAWSMAVLAREVRELYETMSKGLVSSLPELKIQYADYAAWQRQCLRDGLLEERLQYWKKQLGGSWPVIKLAGDHPRPSDRGRCGATKSFSLPPELSQSLRVLSKREGATLFMVLLAAFKTLLSKYTRESDVVIGAVMANRNRAEIAPLVGPFANLLPIRTDLSGNPRFAQLLKRVREATLGADGHQEAPVEHLVDEIVREQGSGQTPLFNIVFGVQNAPEEEITLTELEVGPVTVEQESTRSDLTLWITKGAETIRVAWIYNDSLFGEEGIIRIHNHFETLLSNIVVRPNAPLDEIEMLSEAERAQKDINRVIREERNYSRFKSVKPKAIALSED